MATHILPQFNNSCTADKLFSRISDHAEDADRTEVNELMTQVAAALGQRFAYRLSSAIDELALNSQRSGFRQVYRLAKSRRK